MNISYAGFGAGALGGTWLFLKEAAYAGSHPGSELAVVLQLVAVILVALSVSGVAAATVLQRLLHARQGDAA